MENTACCISIFYSTLTHECLQSSAPKYGTLCLLANNFWLWNKFEFCIIKRSWGSLFISEQKSIYVCKESPMRLIDHLSQCPWFPKAPYLRKYGYYLRTPWNVQYLICLLRVNKQVLPVTQSHLPFHRFFFLSCHPPSKGKVAVGCSYVYYFNRISDSLSKVTFCRVMSLLQLLMFEVAPHVLVFDCQ